MSPVDGRSMEVYVFDVDGPAVRHHVTDRAQVGEVIDYLARSKGRSVSKPDEGAHYESYVISLHDGSTLEALHAYLDPKTNWVWTESTGWLDVNYGGQLVGEDALVRPTDAGQPLELSQVPMAGQRGSA